MKKYLWMMLVVLTAIAVYGSFFVMDGNEEQKNSFGAIPATSSNPQTIPVLEKVSKSGQSQSLVFPISNFIERKSQNSFGEHFPVGGKTNPDISVCPSAKYYSGYHTGLDLEVSAAEADGSVPVLAVTSGTVRDASDVTGYGGLIVVEYDLGGSKYTAYYGHIDADTFKFKKNQKVKAGDELGELGEACSSANGNVRKHLHFGLHKGTAVDVRGYVPNQSDLSTWTDPISLLKSLGAN